MPADHRGIWPVRGPCQDSRPLRLEANARCGLPPLLLGLTCLALSVDVRRRPLMYVAVVTQLDTHQVGTLRRYGRGPRRFLTRRRRAICRALSGSRGPAAGASPWPRVRIGSLESRLSIAPVAEHVVWGRRLAQPLQGLRICSCPVPRIRYLPIPLLTCRDATHWCAVGGDVERCLAAKKRPAWPDCSDASYSPQRVVSLWPGADGMTGSGEVSRRSAPSTSNRLVRVWLVGYHRSAVVPCNARVIACCGRGTRGTSGSRRGESAWERA